MIDLSELLLSERIQTIARKPFYFGLIDDYVPYDIYNSLLDTFPRDSLDFDVAYGQKSRMSLFRTPILYQQFLENNVVWREFISALSSNQFLSNLEAFTKIELFRSRGLTGLRTWKFDTSPEERKLPWQAFTKLNFEFSILPANSFIPPHSDDNKKIVSILFYLPDRSWKKEYGGETRFFAARNLTAERKWSNWDDGHIKESRREEFFSDMKVFSSIEFRPNRLLIFIKSKKSYHDVGLIRCPAHLNRNSLNFNIDLV